MVFQIKLDLNKLPTLKEKEIKYNNLRWIVESVYPQRHIRVVNGKLEVDTKARMKKETLLTVKSVEQVQSNPFEDCEINFAAKAKRNIPSNITDYISHLLLHSIKETSCEHTLVWGGWAKYHPVNKMEKYIEQRDEDGFSKTCIDFQLKMETCDQTLHTGQFLNFITRRLSIPNNFNPLEIRIRGLIGRCQCLICFQILDRRTLLTCLIPNCVSWAACNKNLIFLSREKSGSVFGYICTRDSFLFDIVCLEFYPSA